jgi:hypothetical protein
MERAPEDEAIAEPVDARRFNEVMGSNRFRQADYRRLACRAVDVGIPPGGKVLDMGTGPGFVAIEVARLLERTRCRVVGSASRSRTTFAFTGGTRSSRPTRQMSCGPSWNARG